MKRVVPCDWATPGAKGLRELHDKVRQLISNEAKGVLTCPFAETRDPRVRPRPRGTIHVPRRRLVDADLAPAARA